MAADSDRRTPPVIGGTGHRDLVESETEVLEARIESLFDLLRRRFPNTPLALMSAHPTGLVASHKAAYTHYPLIKSLIKHAHRLPRELYKSPIWDRRSEMADHPKFSLDTDINVCFCNPQHPWQRASNENTNGLLRQYFPKGTDLSNVHQNRLNAVARQLSERPSKTLQFYSPAEKFAQCAASID